MECSYGRSIRRKERKYTYDEMECAPPTQFGILIGLIIIEFLKINISGMNNCFTCIDIF